MDTARILRLINGDWSFGCAGDRDCPRTLHHHHDDFCASPTEDELNLAGIDPKRFIERKRGNDTTESSLGHIIQ